MKKLFMGVLMFAMLVSMAACGGSTSGGGSEGGSESGAAIKIGVSGPLTGGAAQYGEGVKIAAELAVEEINALGGLQFEFNMQDDEADPTKSPNAYGVLKDWGMQLSLGTVTSGAGAAVSPDYQADHIFALTPSASSMDIIYNANSKQYYGSVYQMCFTDPNQGVASADYIAAHPEIGTKIAVISKNDDPYSVGVYEKFMAEAAVVGLDIVSDTVFNDSGAKDFTVNLQDAKDAGADLLFLPIYYTPAAEILTAMSQMAYEPTVFGVDGMDGVLTVDGFDPSLAEGVYLITPFVADASDDLTVNFVKNYQAKSGGTIPNQFAADAYDCIYALYQACNNAGVTADMSPEEITDLMIEQFTTMTFNGLTGENMTWKDTGEVSKEPKAMVIQNGVYVGVED